MPSRKKTSPVPEEQRSVTAMPPGSITTGFAHPVLSGVNVTPDTALGLSAVYCAIKCISETIASLSLPVYKHIAGGRQVDTEHIVYDLLNFEPNEEQTPFKFKSVFMGHVLGWGNGYAEVQRDGAGQPRALRNIHPSHVQPKRHSDGSLYYDIQGGGILLPSDILHVANFGSNDVLGLSPITLARETIGLGLAAEKYGASLFGNSAIPNGIIKVPAATKPDALNNARESFNALYQGPGNAAKIGFLPVGWDWISTSMSMEDAEFLMTRQFQIVEIARLFNLAPTKLQDWSHSTFSNLVEANSDFYQSSIRPWLVALEDEYNRKLFTREQRRTWFCEHNMRSILRGNDEDRAAYYSSLFQMGTLSVNEIRQLENLNPIGPDGDVRMLPGNMTTLDQAGAQINPAAVSQDPDPVADPPPSDQGDDIVKAAVRGVLADAVGRMVRREVQALKRASKKPNFPDAVEDFYTSHGDIVREALAPALSAYSAVSGKLLDADRITRRFVEDSRAAVLDPGEAGLDGLLTAWDGNKVDFVVSKITGEEETWD